LEIIIKLRQVWYVILVNGLLWSKRLYDVSSDAGVIRILQSVWVCHVVRLMQEWFFSGIKLCLWMQRCKMSFPVSFQDVSDERDLCGVC